VVSTIARTPPPAFLFPINDVKDPTGLPAPPKFAPVAAGGGYLVAASVGVNRPFPAFSPIPGDPVFGAKIAAGRRGASLTFRSDSIEAREASDTRRKNQGGRNPLGSVLRGRRPERGAAI
jgi:hypothetical protein